MNYKTLTISLFAISLFGCETLSALPQSFTTKNIMTIQQHMSADTILTLFGNPVSISTAVCGKPSEWTCTTWKYGDWPYEHASFTFYHENGKLFLNNFNIDRD